jgi:hypothetical protein
MFYLTFLLSKVPLVYITSDNQDYTVYIIVQTNTMHHDPQMSTFNVKGTSESHGTTLWGVLCILTTKNTM